jgi:hypothetical protein
MEMFMTLQNGSIPILEAHLLFSECVALMARMHLLVDMVAKADPLQRSRTISLAPSHHEASQLNI